MASIGWVCDVCKSGIDDGEGWLHVPMSEVHQHEDAAAAWRDRHPGDSHSLSDLSKYPASVHWRAVHEACDPTGGEPYLIEIARIRTPWDLVWWSSHLLGKTWIKSTDWAEVLRRKHNESGTVEP